MTQQNNQQQGQQSEPTAPRPTGVPDGPLNKKFLVRMILTNRPLEAEALDYLLEWGVFDDNPTHRAVATLNPPWSLVNIVTGKILDLATADGQNVVTTVLGAFHNPPYNDEEITALQKKNIYVVVPDDKAPPGPFTTAQLNDPHSKIVSHMNEPIFMRFRYGWLLSQYKTLIKEAREIAANAKRADEDPIEKVLERLKHWTFQDFKNLFAYMKHDAGRFSRQVKFSNGELEKKDARATLPMSPESRRIGASFRKATQFCPSWLHDIELANKAKPDTPSVVDVGKDIDAKVADYTLREWGAKELIEELDSGGTAFCEGAIEDIGPILEEVGVDPKHICYPYIVPPGGNPFRDVLFLVGDKDRPGPAQQMVDILRQIGKTGEVEVFALEDRIETFIDRSGAGGVPIIAALFRGLEQGLWPKRAIRSYKIPAVIKWPIYKKDGASGDYVVDYHVNVIHPELYFRHVTLAYWINIWEEIHPAGWMWASVAYLDEDSGVVGTSIRVVLIFALSALIGGMCCFPITFAFMTGNRVAVPSTDGSFLGLFVDTIGVLCGGIAWLLITPLAFHLIREATKGKGV